MYLTSASPVCISVQVLPPGPQCRNLGPPSATEQSASAAQVSTVASLTALGPPTGADACDGAAIISAGSSPAAAASRDPLKEGGMLVSFFLVRNPKPQTPSCMLRLHDLLI